MGSIFDLRLYTLTLVLLICLISRPAHSAISIEDARDVLDMIESVYQPSAEAVGFDLKFHEKFALPVANATGNRTGPLSGVVTIYGGLLKHSLMTKRAFALIVCHELGHVLGGEPTWEGISNSGQPDYYAAAVCMKKLNLDHLSFGNGNPRDIEQSIRVCEGDQPNGSSQKRCPDIVLASLEVVRIIAELTHDPEPKIETPDQTIAWITEQAHPNIQCRLDTFIHGAVCGKIPSGNLLTEIDAVVATCADRQTTARPQCWLAPRASK